MTKNFVTCIITINKLSYKKNFFLSRPLATAIELMFTIYIVYMYHNMCS